MAVILVSQRFVHITAEQMVRLGEKVKKLKQE
jgi:hypothetical protein